MGLGCEEEWEGGPVGAGTESSKKESFVEMGKIVEVEMGWEMGKIGP